MTDTTRSTRAPQPARRLAHLMAGACALVLSACGGGGDASSPGAEAQSATTGTTTTTTTTTTTGTTRQDAFRLLTQATFGPTDRDLADVQARGAAAWVDAQLAKPPSAAYLARWDADNARAIAADPNTNANPLSINAQFYVHALTADDQLRHRVAFALSELLVVSTVELKGVRSRAVAAYADLLERDAFGNYRTLLEDATLSPAMGLYLNAMRNMKENPATGQVPDQNYAREVMQLFSIGLVQLNADGTPKLDAAGHAIDTYGPADIEGLSKVFTGWSYAGPDTSNARFMGSAATADPDRLVKPMQAYPQFHSTSEKRFLGATIAAQATPDPKASLKVALDTIFKHPNVGPFVSRQLIQRLVTSHPSPAYVARVAAVFANNGAGVRGDLKAVVRAILLDAEARSASLPATDAYGKVREPVLRLTAWMRAFRAKSDSGLALVQGTDDPGLALGQSPGRAPSVFNYFRPGFVAAGTLTGARALTMPELQVTTETSVAGYVDYMSGVVARGVGLRGLDGKAVRPDVQPDLAPELALADQPAALVDDVCARLVGDGATAAYKAELVTAVSSIAVPALKAGNTNLAQVNAARRNRVNAAVLLVLASPEFIVQK